MKNMLNIAGKPAVRATGLMGFGASLLLAQNDPATQMGNSLLNIVTGPVATVFAIGALVIAGVSIMTGGSRIVAGIATAVFAVILIVDAPKIVSYLQSLG